MGPPFSPALYGKYGKLAVAEANATGPMGEGGLIVRPPPVRPVPAAASLIAARHEIMACACGEMDSNKRPGREETCRNEMTIARKSYGDDVEMVCRKKGMEKKTEEARRHARAC